VPKILIVEDDLDIAEKLALFLTKSGFSTEHLATGERVVETVKSACPDLILLDLMLPIKDGGQCCIEIREFSDVPIIMTTAKVEEVDRLVGLQSGTDDYVCKPYSVMELVLRIKAILKRVGTQEKTAEQLLIETNTLNIAYQGKQTALTSLEFSLFELLFKTPNRIYSRNQILDLAYADMRDISDRAIDSHVKKIRKKIRSLGIDSNVIESVYGAGYRYVEVEGNHCD